LTNIIYYKLEKYICQTGADIFRGRPPNLFELKICTPFTPLVGNVLSNVGFPLLFSFRVLTWETTDGRSVA